MLQDGEVYYYLRDHTYSIHALANEEGEIVENYAYTAFGQTTIYEGDTQETILEHSNYNNPFGFTGREYDSNTRLYHYRNRTYHPSLARFLQRDPKGYVDGLNLYAYVRNNPLRYVDPMGTTSQKLYNYAQQLGTLDWEKVAMLQEYKNSLVTYVDHSIEDSVDSLNNTFNQGYSYVSNEIREGNDKMFNIFNGTVHIINSVSGSIGEVGNKVRSVTFNDVRRVAFDHLDSWSLLYQRRDQIEINKALNGGWNGMIGAHNNAPWYARAVLYTAMAQSAGPMLKNAYFKWGVPAVNSIVVGASSMEQNYNKYDGLHLAAHVGIDTVSGYVSALGPKKYSSIEDLAKFSTTRGFAISGLTEFAHQVVDDEYSLTKWVNKSLLGAVGRVQSEGYAQSYTYLGGNKHVGNLLGVLMGESFNRYTGGLAPTNN
jgi:RHS repeat-associated protein